MTVSIYDCSVSSVYCILWREVSFLIRFNQCLLSKHSVRWYRSNTTPFQGYGPIHIDPSVEKFNLACTGYFNIQ